MKSVTVKSATDCVRFVMDYCDTKTFAVISIQNDTRGGVGFTFNETDCLKDVLTLYFDDISMYHSGYTMFSSEQARQIIQFIHKNKDKVDFLLVHCGAGESRSVAVGAFAEEMLELENKNYASLKTMNPLVYSTLKDEYARMQNESV